MMTKTRIFAAAFCLVSIGALGSYAIAQEGFMGGHMGIGSAMRGMHHGMSRGGSGHDHGARGMGRGPGAAPDDHMDDASHREGGVRRNMGPASDMGMGRGMGMGMGMGRGMGMMGGNATASERQELHAMFVNHDQIRRTVTNLPDGIRTVTESDDPELARTILSHVAGMMKRVDEGRDPRLPIQSPTLQTIFRNKDKIETTYDSTPTGIVVKQTSNDAETVAALQKHAAEVTDLARRGMIAAHETMMRNAGGRRAGHDAH